MRPEDRGYLTDIATSARIAMEYLEGKNPEDIFRQIQIQDSVVRRILIVGEAARRLSEEAKSRAPEIEWRNVVDMRNFLMHQYGDVDPRLVWDAVKIDLPRLLAVVQRILDQEP